MKREVHFIHLAHIFLCIRYSTTRSMCKIFTLKRLIKQYKGRHNADSCLRQVRQLSKAPNFIQEELGKFLIPKK